MTRELPPTRWALVPPPVDHPHDLWATGASLDAGTILQAYRLGLFPMPLREGELGWFSPAIRAQFPVAHALPRTVRRARSLFEIKVDTAFPEVIAGCADPGRSGGWIDAEMTRAYTELHDLGWVHSVEAWDGDGLAGGLYGISIGGLFAAESMFQTRPEASKAALAGLHEILRASAEPAVRILDAQWPTPHLELLGAHPLSRGEYLSALNAALDLSDPFER